MAIPLQSRRQVSVCIGQAGIRVGSLTYAKHGRREHCAFAYHDDWLTAPDRFTISADLALAPGHQPHKAMAAHDSLFHGALADTAPDAWGRRVIARDHAKRRRRHPKLPALTELDYLLAVDDFSRVGALRLQDEHGQWLSTRTDGQRSTPPLIEIGRIYQSSQAVERGQETEEDLRYLQGKGTSLGGMRPKCTLVDHDGHLAIGKFPSVNDARSVTRCEILALHLAQLAGIDVPQARIVTLDDTAIALIRRFDRDNHGGRIPYQSAASMLQVSREDERSYLDIADMIRAHGDDPKRDLSQLWRRLVFNLLITNVDDHLQNHGFLHVHHGLWRLSPAFDLNPFPDKERESKVWLSERDGPITDLHMLLARAPYFGLDDARAKWILETVFNVVEHWRKTALAPDIGLSVQELDDIAPAFEHEQVERCRTLLGRR